MQAFSGGNPQDRSTQNGRVNCPGRVDSLTSGPMFRSISVYAIAMLGAGLTPLIAFAHPHEFVDTGLSFRFDQKGLLGAISVVWVYDELTSLLILEDLGMDRDGNGVLTEDEAARLTEMSGSWPEEFDGNLTLVLDGKAVRLSGPLEATAGLRDGRLYMTHIRALPDRIDPAMHAIMMQVYDPSYYIFYDIIGMPQVVGRLNCDVSREAADIARAQRLYDEALAGMTDEELMDQGLFPEIGGAFAETVRLTCEAPR